MVVLGIIANPLELATWVPDDGFSAKGIKDSKSRQHQ
jgi:hypothetical protein